MDELSVRGRADPSRRRVGTLLFGLALSPMLLRPTPAAADVGGFLAGLWPEARARGIRRTTFDRAFAGLTFDPGVLDKTRGQAEFRKTLGDYLAAAVSDKRIAAGRTMARDWAPWLARIEARFGVDRRVILGGWGLESNFGTHCGDLSVIRCLATLAAARYRGAYFRHELIEALLILDAGHITPDRMLGSWAGAMGQTQFMPSSFKVYAVDADGDGRRDIWTSVPDALASTANFLHRHGWKAGQGWGCEVSVPEGLSAANGRRAMPFPTWQTHGVERADGRPLPRQGVAALLRPAGPEGPVFLVTPNFHVIKRYNNATSYALGVALLGDRIAGAGPLKAAWPERAGPAG